jgi:hypothetical protein
MPPIYNKKMASTHNLDINKYTLEEIFGLFDLDYNLTEQTMRAAKMKVLMIHPDKSRLPANYFHFYKQAYEIVLNIYKQKNRGSANQASNTGIGNNNADSQQIDVSKKVSSQKLSLIHI